MLLAFFGVAFYPLCISYGGEITFPIDPSLVNGMFTLFDGTISIALALVGAFIVKEKEGDEDLTPEDLLEA